MRPSARRSLSAVVEKSADAEQKRRERISLLPEVEEPDCGQNAYDDHSHNFVDYPLALHALSTTGLS